MLHTKVPACFIFINTDKRGREITDLKIKSINIVDLQKKRKVTSSYIVLQTEKKIFIIQEERLRGKALLYIYSLQFSITKHCEVQVVKSKNCGNHCY